MKIGQKQKKYRNQDFCPIPEGKFTTFLAYICQSKLRSISIKWGNALQRIFYMSEKWGKFGADF